MLKSNYLVKETFHWWKATAILMAVMLLTIAGANAQFTNVACTGYNADLVANGAGFATTSATNNLDAATGGFVFVTNDFNCGLGLPASAFLPPSLNIASTVAPGLTYTLQPYAGSNAVRIPLTGNGLGSGTLTLNTPILSSNLYILCVSGGGPIASGLNVVVTFSDATNQTFTALSSEDWCNTTPATNANGVTYTKITTTQYNRVGYSATCTSVGICQYFAELSLPISGSNYGKTITSIAVTKTAGAAIFSIFGVGSKAPCAVPADQPTAFTPGVINPGSINASFTAASSAPTGYLVVRYPNGATPTNPVDVTTYTTNQALGLGTVVQASSSTSFTATGLFGGTTYDFYIYSYNAGATCGGPIYQLVTPLFASQATSACGGLAGGTYSVGPTGTYLTLTDALTAAGAGVTGPVIFELQSSYTSAGETFPLTINSNPCITPTNNVTIRPEVASPMLSITSNNPTGTVLLNGATYITFDGRPGGVGSTNMLTIANTNAGASYAVNLSNDASNNTFTYCNITSRNNSPTSGTIVFGGGTVLGNDNNTISNCNISDDASASFPLCAIYSSGTSSAIDNSNNTVSNCNISNYFNALVSAYGIFLSSNNSGWSLTGNRLFQTADRIYTAAAIQFGISITSGAGYTINNNVIGFANASGTGTTNNLGRSAAGTFAGTFPSSYTLGTATLIALRYFAISVNFTSGGAVSNIQGNTIGGFTHLTSSGTTSTTTGAFCAIAMNGGNANIGTVSGNTIGATSGTGSIYLAANTAGSTVVGIYAATTSGNAVSIQNNNIGAIDASGTSATTAASFAGINSNTNAGNVTITNNNIGNTTAFNIRTGYLLTGANLSNAATTPTTATGTSSCIGINNLTATGNSITITGNTFRNWQVSGSASTVVGMTNSGAMTGANPSVNLNGNFLGTAATGAGAWVTYAVANSGALTGILTSNTIATTHNIQNNDFRGIVHSAAGTHAHTYINMTGATAANNVATISGNTFTNLNVNTTGSVTFISHSYVVAATGTQNINNNSIITAFNKGGAGGTVLGTTTGSFSAAGSILNQTNNNFSNITVTGATAITGINNNDGTVGTIKTITGNILNNWVGGTSAINGMVLNYHAGNSSISSNTITNITGQAAITGITLAASNNTANPLLVSNNNINNLSSTGTGGNVIGITCSNTSPLINITGNNINTLSSTGASAVNGIAITGATLTNVFKNTIHNLSANGASTSTNGVVVSGGATVNVHNNLIGNLFAPLANAAIPVTGITVSGGTTHNLTYNTIYLNATSTGALFGSAGIYLSSTTPNVTLRNNLVSNTSTPSGAGFTAALRRTATAFTGYNTASNNNLFYAGTPSANMVIYYDGTNSYGNGTSVFGPVSTPGSFQAFVTPRETSSISEVISSSAGVTFQGLTGPATGSSAIFLHLVSGLATQMESGGTPVASPSITDDYDSQARNASTPDIGADEFNGITPAPSITFNSITPSTNQCVATARAISLDATTPSGTITGVMITYSYNGASQGSFAMANPSGNNWTYTIPSTTIPTNAVVTWSATATNSGFLMVTYNGASYQDDPLLGVTVVATANPASVCVGDPVTLTGTTNGSLVNETFENASFPLTTFAVSTISGSGHTATQNTTYFAEGTSSVRFNTTVVNSSGQLAYANNIDLTTYSSAQLTFKHIAAMESPSTSFDFGYAEYSIDGGANWITFPQTNYVGTANTAVFTGGTARFSTRSYANWISAFTSAASLPNNTLWQTETFNVPSSALTSTQFKLRFRYTTDVSTNYYGWLIDDVQLVGVRNYSNYGWTSSNTPFTASTQNTSDNPAVSTTYTFTATNALGCSVSANTALVAVNALPSAPTAANSTQCGYGVPTASVTSTSGQPTPSFKWYSASTGGTLLQTSTSNTYTSAINANTTFHVSEVVGVCESSPRTPVTVTVTPADAVAVVTNAQSCVGTANPFSVNQTGSNQTYTSYTWSATPAAGSGVSGSPTGASQNFTATANGNYAYAVVATDGSCSAVDTLLVSIYTGLTGTATPTQITSCVNPTGLITANVSGAGTVVNNDFTSSTLPSYMEIPATVNGLPNDAVITGGRLQLTPAINGKKGGVLISNTTGIATSDFQIDFDFITTSGGVAPADGLSYSYGDDVVAFPPGSSVDGQNLPGPWAENGSGTKLKLSFDAINNTGGCGAVSGVTSGNVAGVYLMYNLNQNSQLTTCPGVLYYGPDVSWRATTTTGATTHVTIKINALGQVSMILNNVTVVNNVQLPASYLTADKSNWKHAFAARTGGLNEGHYIDNLLIQYNNFYEYSIDGGSNWSQTNPIIPPTSGTYSVDARYVSVPGCFANLGSVTINAPNFTTNATQQSICAYTAGFPTLSFSPAFGTGATYQWESSPAGMNTWADVIGETNTTYVLTAGAITADTDFRCKISCGGNQIPGSPTSINTIAVVSPTVATTSSPNVRCGPGVIQLSGTASLGADLNWYTTPTLGTPTMGFTYNASVTSGTTNFYVSAIQSGCESGRTTVVTTVTPSTPVSAASSQPTVCNGQSATLTATSANPNYNYTWNPGGLTGASVSVSPTINTTYTLDALDPNDQCAATASVTVNAVNQDPPIPAVNTPQSVCEGTTLSLTANNSASGQTSTYGWATNAANGFTATNTQSPSITASATPAQDAGTYTVTVSNQFLCTASASIVVTIDPAPILGGSVVSNVSCWGTSDICDGAVLAVGTGGTGTLVYDDGTNFNVDGDFSLNQPNGQILVCFGPFSVTVTDALGCTGTQTYNVGAISTTPPTASVVVPPIVNLPAFACNGTVVNNINVPTVAGGTTKYIWDAPAGSTLNGSNPYTSATPNANLTFGALVGSNSGYYIGVQAGNGCGTSLRKVQWVRGILSSPTVTGPTVICGGGSGSYSITNPAAMVGAQSYTWTGPVGSTIDGNPTPYTTTSTAAVTLVVPGGFTSGTMCVVANAGCISTPPKCISISTTPAVLGQLSGNFTVCPPATEVYTVSNPGVVGGTYNWTIPLANATSAGSTTNSITVNFLAGYSGGDLKVTYTNTCGVTSTLRSKSIGIGLPTVPASITAPNTNGLCAQLASFGCPPQGGANFNWTFPTGSSPASITAGGNNVSSTMPGAPFTSGQVCVTATNGCGTSTARCITVKGTPLTPGVTTTNPSSWCAPASAVQFIGNVSALTGVYSLNWTVLPAAAASYVSGQGTSNYTADWNTVGAASINLTATNACGSTTRALAVNIGSCLRAADATATIAAPTVNVYPNPATELITITYGATQTETVQLQLKDVSGRVVMNSSLNAQEGENQSQMDVSTLAKGVYMLEVNGATAKQQVRVVVQ